MATTVELPDALHTKLQALGGQLFSVPDVIARLVDGLDTPPTGSSGRGPRPVGPPSTVKGGLGILASRAPRERGATVEIDGQRIHAGTVSDLYEQAFRLILGNGKAEQLKQMAPYRTSNQRYLYAREPNHPSGKPFFVDVKVGPYHIEAHKNYEQAIKQLADLLARLNIGFKYLG